MGVNITFGKIIKCFLTKGCRESHWTWVYMPNQHYFFLFFQKCPCTFFLSRFLIDRCRIVTDTWYLQSLIWSHSNHLYRSPNNNIRWSLHFLCLNYHLLAQNLFSFEWILPQLRKTLIYSGSFSKDFETIKNCCKTIKSRPVTSLFSHGLWYPCSRPFK